MQTLARHTKVALVKVKLVFYRVQHSHVWLYSPSILLSVCLQNSVCLKY